MEQTEQQSLFDSKLNETGKIFIRKFAVATRILLILGILLSLIFLFEATVRLIRFDSSFFPNDKLLRFEYRIFPFYSVIYTTLALLQLYYYWKVGKCLKIGADYNDEIAFNESFSALYRNAVISIIVFSLAVLMSLLELYVLVRFYLR